jgi:putative transposase
MPNHFHFMIHTDEKCLVLEKQGGNMLNPISNAVRILLSGYARIYNSRYSRSGSIFRQKTKAKCLTEISLDKSGAKENLFYATTCFHYIHQNPLVAGLCKSMEDWPYSSFKDYFSLNQASLCNMDLAAKYCGFQPSSFVETSLKRYNLKIERGSE